MNPFHHAALLYRTNNEYLAGTTGFVHDALGSGHAVLVAVPGRRLERIREALATVAGHVAFADMAVVGRNPGRIIPSVLLRFADAHAGRRVSIIGEPIWPGRTAVEYPACAAHEALINAVFAGKDATILCPYDVDGLDAPALDDARRTHPVLINGAGAARPSDRYADPLATAASFNRPLPLPPPDEARHEFHASQDLPELRAFVRGRTRGALPADRADDLLLAVNEVATNAVQYAGGGRLAVWTEPGLVICQVEDSGRLIDPLAGRVPPEPARTHGRGLILAHQLCDLLRIHAGRSGTTIRLQMQR
ncbi:MAG: anti-sigma factor RsbA family regulatory protein [Actinoplanes sp.]